ncbi:MAG TPA: hypothetical protein VGK81_04160 [Anaerolineae bacterium]
MNAQKALPVVTSIVIILVVAFLRDRSKVLATIFATMPINMPLALWVMISDGPEDSTLLATYVRSFMIGLVPAFIWLGVVYFCLRLGWTLLGSIGAGYLVWAVLIALLLALGVLSVNK